VHAALLCSRRPSRCCNRVAPAAPICVRRRSRRSYIGTADVPWDPRSANRRACHAERQPRCGAQPHDAERLRRRTAGNEEEEVAGRCEVGGRARRRCRASLLGLGVAREGRGLIRGHRVGRHDRGLTRAETDAAPSHPCSGTVPRARRTYKGRRAAWPDADVPAVAPTSIALRPTPRARRETKRQICRPETQLRRGSDGCRAGAAPPPSAALNRGSRNQSGTSSWAGLARTGAWRNGGKRDAEDARMVKG
jgi:hypothetical protein